MTKKEVAYLLQKIDMLYPSRLKTDNIQELINTWYDVLKDTSFDLSYEKLLNHAKINKFPPSVSELILETNRSTKTKEQLEHERMIKQLYGG